MSRIPPGACRSLAAILSALALSIASSPAAEQAPLSIRHQAVGCLLRDRYPLLHAQFFPTEEIRSAKLYFRSERFPDFYYVAMKAAAKGSYEAVIPKPGPETDRIVYYIEVIGVAFDSVRTEEHVTEIGEDCRHDPEAAYFPGENPGITVGATQAGAAAIPPGFQAGGITGFISAAGAGASAGSGIGVGTAILIGAGAAAGVGVIGASTGGDGSTTSQPSGVMVTTTSLGSTSTTTSASASSTTSTVPPGQPSSSTTSAPPDSSTTSTTTTAPPATTSTTTTSIATPSACFTLRSLAGCKVEVDAGCSTGTISEYRWTFHQSFGPVNEIRSTATPFVHDWASDSACGGPSCSFSRQVELVVVGPGGSNRFTDNARVTCLTGLAAEETGLFTSFVSFLAVRPVDGSTRGQVLLNPGRVDVVDSSASAHHHLRARAGESTVEAHILTAVSAEGFWRFDFSGAEHFVPGSLLVDAGAVVSLDAYSVVFRLGGVSGERIRFRYRLSPR